MATETRRRALHATLAGVLGDEAAETMMEMLPPDLSDLARRSDISELRGQMGELRGDVREQIGELRGEMGTLRGEMGELRGEMGTLRGAMGELRGEMGELRGDVRALDSRLTGEIVALGARVDARFDAQFPKLVMANLFSSAAFAGLVFGAVRLAG